MTGIRESVGNLLPEVRQRLGSPTQETFSDDLLQTAVDLALEDVSRVAPLFLYEKIGLRTNVEEYEVKPEVVDVLDLWMPSPQSSLKFAPGIDEALGASGFHPEYAGLNLFHSPSLMHILEHKWEQWKYRHGYGWEWNPDSRKIMIIPAPQSSGTAVYKGTRARTLDTIPEKYARAFKDLVYAEALEIFANALLTKSSNRGGQVTSVPIGIGSVSYSDHSVQFSARQMERADKIREKALRKFGSAGGAVVIG